MEIKLKDGTWLEAEFQSRSEMPLIYGEPGLSLHNVLISDKGGRGTRTAKEVYVPMSAILFIVKER